MLLADLAVQDGSRAIEWTGDDRRLGQAEIAGCWVCGVPEHFGCFP